MPNISEFWNALRDFVLRDQSISVEQTKKIIEYGERLLEESPKQSEFNPSSVSVMAESVMALEDDLKAIAEMLPYFIHYPKITASLEQEKNYLKSKLKYYFDEYNNMLQNKSEVGGPNQARELKVLLEAQRGDPNRESQHKQRVKQYIKTLRNYSGS